MTDLRLLYNGAQGRADLRLAGAALDTSEDLATAVTVSLFTDRLVEPTDPVPPNTDDRRGCWIDSYADIPGDRFGSRLWLLNRSKSDAALPLRAKGYILEALQWLIEDGVAGRIDAECAFLQGDQRRLGAVVTIWRPGVRNPVTIKFDWAWQDL